MKALGISGSPRPGGNTDHLINLALDVINQEGIETEFLSLDFCQGIPNQLPG
jgi:multimeric flavodoxin WrbA